MGPKKIDPGIPAKKGDEPPDVIEPHDPREPDVIEPPFEKKKALGPKEIK
jgi:hypothetical protein